MKKLLVLMAVLFSINSVAGDEAKAVKAIEKVLKIQLTKKLKPAIKTVIKKLGRKYGRKPTTKAKALGAFVKVIKEVTSPDITYETNESKTNIKLIQFKDLLIKHSRKGSDLSIDFKANKKETSFKLNMSF